MEFGSFDVFVLVVYFGFLDEGIVVLELLGVVALVGDVLDWVCEGMLGRVVLWVKV